MNVTDVEAAVEEMGAILRLDGADLHTIEIDPRRVLLLDVNRTNNTMARSAAGTGRAATKWAGRWMVWFEELLLTYTSL